MTGDLSSPALYPICPCLHCPRTAKPMGRVRKKERKKGILSPKHCSPSRIRKQEEMSNQHVISPQAKCLMTVVVHLKENVSRLTFDPIYRPSLPPVRLLHPAFPSSSLFIFMVPTRHLHSRSLPNASSQSLREAKKMKKLDPNT